MSLLQYSISALKLAGSASAFLATRVLIFSTTGLIMGYGLNSAFNRLSSQPHEPSSSKKNPPPFTPDIS